MEAGLVDFAGLEFVRDEQGFLVPCDECASQLERESRPRSLLEALARGYDAVMEGVTVTSWQGDIITGVLGHEFLDDDTEGATIIMGRGAVYSGFFDSFDGVVHEYLFGGYDSVEPLIRDEAAGPDSEPYASRVPAVGDDELAAWEDFIQDVKKNTKKSRNIKGK